MGSISTSTAGVSAGLAAHLADPAAAHADTAVSYTRADGSKKNIAAGDDDVGAALNRLDDTIAALSGLTTTAKSSVVAAVNEVDANADAAAADAADAVADAASALAAVTAAVSTTSGGAGNSGKLLELDGDGKAHGRVLSTDGTKLDGVETGADVTTAARVLAALAGAGADIDVNSQKIVDLAAPTALGHAARWEDARPVQILAPVWPISTNLRAAVRTEIADSANGNRPWVARIAATSGVSGPTVFEVSGAGRIHWVYADGTTATATFDARNADFGAPRIFTPLLGRELPRNSATITSIFRVTGYNFIATGSFPVALGLLLAPTLPADVGSGAEHHLLADLRLSATNDTYTARFRRTIPSTVGGAGVTADIAESANLAASVNLTTGYEVQLTVTPHGVVSMHYREVGGAFTLVGTTTVGDCRIVGYGLLMANPSSTVVGGDVDVTATPPALVSD